MFFYVGYKQLLTCHVEDGGARDRFCKHESVRWKYFRERGGKLSAGVKMIHRL